MATKQRGAARYERNLIFAVEELSWIYRQDLFKLALVSLLWRNSECWRVLVETLSLASYSGRLIRSTVDVCGRANYDGSLVKEASLIVAVVLI
jgi:hypothetical protein